MKMILLASVALISLVFPSNVFRAQEVKTGNKKMSSVNYLVGTWSCAHQVGDFSGKYTTTYEKVHGGRWLKETYEFPPRQFGGNPQAVTAEALIGYDDQHAQWVRFFVDSIGDYFSIRMKDTGNGWAYEYVSFFGTVAEKTSADATFTKKSDTEYVIDGPTYPENGRQVTEHHQCRKQ